MRDKEEAEYLEKVTKILSESRSQYKCLQGGPGQLLDHLYIGSKEDAKKKTLLKCLKITHILNCAATKDYSSDNFDQNPYDGFTYDEFEAFDNDGYPILMHFNKAKRFIDDARARGGRVLVHCEMGINRSGAICVAYMMVRENMTLLQALRLAKMERPVILINEGFRKQLVTFARDRDLLYRS